MPIALRDEFPLNILEPALAKFQPPEGDFAADGAWSHRYGLYTIGQRSLARVGSLELQRSAARGGPMLRMEYRKQAAGGAVNVIDAEIRSDRGAGIESRDWRVTFRTLASGGKTIAGIGIGKFGRVDGKAIEIRDGGTSRRVPRPESFAVSWALFDAVQRLPRKPGEPTQFTLLDNFDQVKPNHTLSYRKATEVLLGGKRVQKQHWEQLGKGRIRKTTWAVEGQRTVRLHGFDHLGDGIVPEVYWVDGRGRLLFMVAGIEAYVWEAAK